MQNILLHWNTIYYRISRWAKHGVINMVFAKLQEKQVVRIKTEALSMDSTKPVVPPRSNCKKPWRYNKKIYKRRNGIERLFRRIKAFGRVCTRYEKLDVMYLAFLNLALIYDELK